MANQFRCTVHGDLHQFAHWELFFYPHMCSFMSSIVNSYTLALVPVNTIRIKCTHGLYHLLNHLQTEHSCPWWPSIAAVSNSQPWLHRAGELWLKMIFPFCFTESQRVFHFNKCLFYHLPIFYLFISPFKMRLDDSLTCIYKFFLWHAICPHNLDRLRLTSR